MGGEIGGGYQVTVFAFFFLSFVFCLMFPVPLFKWLEHDVSWGFFSLFSLFLVPLTSS